PGPAAPGDDLEARRPPAVRAARLRLVESLDALGEREGLIAGVRRVGVVTVPALAADEALARLPRLDDPQHVRRAVRLGAPRLLADDAGTEHPVVVHPGPDLAGELAPLGVLVLGADVVAHLVEGVAQHVATVGEHLVLGRLAGLDLIPLRLHLRGHGGRRHAWGVVLEGLRHRDARLRGLRRVAEDIAAVVQLLDDVRAGRPAGERALLHHLDD